MNYKKSVYEMSVLINKDLLEEAPKKSDDIFVLYTPEKYVDAGRELLKSKETNNSKKQG